MFSKLFQILFVLSLGIFFALLFSVPVRKINLIYGKNFSLLKHKKKIRNILSVFTWYGALFLFILLVLGMFYYSIANYFSQVSWNEFMDKITVMIDRISENIPLLKDISLEPLTVRIIPFLVKIPGTIGKLFIAVLISIYLLIDWDYYLSAFRNWKRNCLTPKGNKMLSVFLQETKDNLFGYLKGQSLDALLMGFLLSIGLWLLKVPLGIPIGILAGIGNLIPYLGPIIAFSLTTIACLIEQRVRTLIIAIIYLILIQQLDSSLIGPRLLGKQLKIRPLFVVLSILIGGTLFGPIGMFLGVPAAGIIKSMLIKFFSKRK